MPLCITDVNNSSLFFSYQYCKKFVNSVDLVQEPTSDFVAFLYVLFSVPLISTFIFAIRLLPARSGFSLLFFLLYFKVEL